MPAAGAGKCTPACATDADCRDGFTCNTNRGVCSGIAQACTVTNGCGSASRVCVGGACVPRSAGSPRDATCAAGTVCIDGYCK